MKTTKKIKALVQKTIKTRNTFLGAAFLLIFLSLNAKVSAMELSDFVQGGAAFLTQIAAHESGHHIAATMVEGENPRMDFFKNQDGNFFLGVSSVKSIEPESVLPFRAAGVVASNHLFNLALSDYRRFPTTYNKTLMFFSGTDFLWYSIWSFYIQDSKDPSYDPVGISQETGISPHAIAGAALLQSAINYYRMSSQDDSFIPYFKLDEDRADFGVTFHF